MRTRNPADLSAEILEGHMSSTLCHLSNIAYRVDRTVHFDNASETFTNDEAANALLSRTPRGAYAVPSKA
ncbi:MAG: hypothetical protein SGI77_16765 [Pirellulaceae bacterium]|nr:hypothetical protein [Pirellulaceae bacterium]